MVKRRGPDAPHGCHLVRFVRETMRAFSAGERVVLPARLAARLRGLLGAEVSHVVVFVILIVVVVVLLVVVMIAE